MYVVSSALLVRDKYSDKLEISLTKVHLLPRPAQALQLELSRKVAATCAYSLTRYQEPMLSRVTHNTGAFTLNTLYSQLQENNPK